MGRGTSPSTRPSRTTHMPPWEEMSVLAARAISFVIGAQYQQVMGVMGHSGGHSSASDTEPVDKTEPPGAGVVMPLQYHGLEDVLDRVGLQQAVFGSQDGKMLPE